jgi:hypothetical protein
MTVTLRQPTPGDAEALGDICYGLYGEPAGAWLPSVLF